MPILCIGMIVTTINMGPPQWSVEYKIFLVSCESIFNMVFMLISFLSLFGKKIEERKKGGMKREKRSRIQGKITELTLWRPVLQGRSVAKCDPDHELITLLVLLTDMPKKRGVTRWDPAHVASRGMWPDSPTHFELKNILSIKYTYSQEQASSCFIFTCILTYVILRK